MAACHRAAKAATRGRLAPVRPNATYRKVMGAAPAPGEEPMIIRRALTSILGLAVVLAAILLVPALANAHPGHDHAGRAAGHIPAASGVTEVANSGSGPAASANAAVSARTLADGAGPAEMVTSETAASETATSETVAVATPGTDPGLRGPVALMAVGCTVSGCPGPGCPGPGCPGCACSGCGALSPTAATPPWPPLATVRPVGAPEPVHVGTASAGLERPPRSFV